MVSYPLEEQKFVPFSFFHNLPSLKIKIKIGKSFFKMIIHDVEIRKEDCA